MCDQERMVADEGQEGTGCEKTEQLGPFGTVGVRPLRQTRSVHQGHQCTPCVRSLCSSTSPCVVS